MTDYYAYQPPVDIPPDVFIAYRVNPLDPTSEVIVLTQAQAIERQRWYTFRAWTDKEALIAFMSRRGAWTCSRMDGRMDDEVEP